MDEPTFGEQFIRSKGQPFEYQGVLVHGIFCRELRGEARLRIRFIKASLAVPQAIRLKSYNSALLFGDRALTDVELWADSSPRELDVVVKPAKPRRKKKEQPASLVKVWNAWKDDEGILQAWIGNGGMQIEEGDGGETLLRCSDGVGPPDFSDLVVSLKFLES